MLRTKAENAVTMNADRSLSAANTQLKVKGVKRLGVQRGQKVAKASLLVVRNLAADTSVITAYIDKNFEKTNPKKVTLKITGTSLLATEESVGSAAFTANNVETRKENLRKDYNEHPSTAVVQQIIPSISDVHVHAISNAGGVQLVSSHVNLVRNYHALMNQGKVEAFFAKLFIIKVQSGHAGDC